MAERYDPQELEPRWRARWAEDNLDHAPDDDPRPKWYALTMLPYPSGDLHTGHWYAMAPSDAAARYRRMLGYNVMFPMGFDAFGLPAENAAIKNGMDPAEWTYANIDRMRGQLRQMGASFDWEREMVSCDPDYYRWTQWWFLKLYEKGLAYRAKAAANWCPGCNTVLANEQVVNGLCERSDDPVERRFLTQWFFKITDYADELLRFDGIEWPERIRTMQTNWIGRSEGANIDFAVDVESVDESLTVFTTRPDTVFGATFMVLAPEHALVDQITTDAQRAEIDEYRATTARATEIERLSTEREKSGAFTGAYAINPLNGQRIPIWIADYVLVTYGTGAIMAVPAHDQRDFEFATKFGLDVIPVFDHDGIDTSKPLETSFAGGGRMINSGKFDGTPHEEAIPAIIEQIRGDGLGDGAVTYRLRDWLISRQRYWGAPIPIIHCEACGIVPVPEDQLPVKLPEKVTFKPTGESPLTLIDEWVNTECPSCGAAARRETDTMDTFMCSSWYFMRYVDPDNDQAPLSRELADKWLPVDLYTGGAEHAVMHLLYSRFFWKAARDMDLVSGDEPMLRLFNQGVILGPDGNRMSKSRGNVVAPDDQVQVHGSDAFRLQLMFIGPWDHGGPYNPSGMPGIVRWLNRAWSVVTEPPEHAGGDEDAAKAIVRARHQAVEQATRDIEALSFNTMIARLMEFTSTLQKARDAGPVPAEAWDDAVDTLILLMAPLAPHIAEEFWSLRGRPYSVHQQSWPTFDATLAKEDEEEIVVQVNGKVRGHISFPAGASVDEIKAAALAFGPVQERLNGEPKKVIVVPGRLVNVVV